jgi:hypothetical protein
VLDILDILSKHSFKNTSNILKYMFGHEAYGMDKLDGLSRWTSQCMNNLDKPLIWIAYPSWKMGSPSPKAKENLAVNLA